MYTRNEKIVPRDIEEEVKDSYLNYAMSVIVGRALPDVRDGLKPAHRRALFAMKELNLEYPKPYKKCARIVGEILGKYHPHGDAAVYDTLVRMAQDFSLRYPLVDGQGNFGCFTKDTKVKLTDGRNLSFEELIKEYKAGKKNYTYTIAVDGYVKIAEIKKPRLTKRDAEIMKVYLDNGEEIKCTLNHKFMLLNGTYKEAEDLITGESLTPLYLRLVTVQRSEVNQGVIPAQAGIQRGHDRMDARFHGHDKNGRRELPEAELLLKLSDKNEINRNHKVKKIEFIKKCEDVYDLTIENTHNFALASGVFVHNSVDGDSAAAMRYTEARLASISDEMLADIDKDTVNFGPNFDASLQEPLLLPAVLPNLLINGSSGIAVGMATNIPPHNLNEIADAVSYLLDNQQAQIKDLMRYVKGPDFPTGGVICGKQGIKDAYESGRGKLTVRGRASIEHQKTGKDLIVVTEIPYQVQKAGLIEAIAGLVDEKKIEGISDIRDESDRDGMRVVIELKRDVESQIILNQLFKHTQLEVTFGIIMLALVDNRPRVLNLRQILEYYISHRKEIIRRRTQFDLDKALKRAHILEGLKIALKYIDQIIKAIKTSKSTEQAKERLIQEFELSSVQAQAILEMQLQRLTALERDKIDAEYAELLKKIEICKAILALEKKVEAIIKEELENLKKKYGDERRTDIVGEAQELEIEDLIAEEDVVVTVSHNGYIKRLPVSAYRKQKRGGKGTTGAEVKEEDFTERLFVASTKDYLLVFTDKGQVHWLKVYEIPQAGKLSKGRAIVNILQIQAGAKISATIPIKEFSEDKYLVMVTKKGLIKKTQLDAYINARKGGIIGITLEKDDELKSIELIDGLQELLIGTRQGKAIRFSGNKVRDMGRGAKGVRGIRLSKKDEVIGMAVPKKDSTILTVTELGFAKRTTIDDYRLTSRGGKGVVNIKVTDKNGEAASLKSVTDKDELMVITQNGIFLRCAVKDIRETGRSAQGVRLIKLEDKDRVSSVAHVVAEEE
ncbi:MAG: DNA gyrase subunit A [Candidatus Omnitrophota bacterium]|nr:DNA gyrase subunit A [Candidatus Omnitrophota bacterium]